MKKLVLLLMIFTFAFDQADAQMMFNPLQNKDLGSGVIRDESGTFMAKKAKRRKTSRKRSKSKSSEDAMKIGAGAFIGFPTGDLGKVSKPGFGGIIDFDYPIEDKDFTTGGFVGYVNFAFDEKKTLGPGNFSTIPICAKLNYFFSKGAFQPYAGISFGYFINSFKQTIGELNAIPSVITGQDSAYVTITSSYTESSQKVGLVPTVGFDYGFTDNLFFHFNAKYYLILAKTSSNSREVDDESGPNFTFMALQFGLMYAF